MSAEFIAIARERAREPGKRPITIRAADLDIVTAFRLLQQGAELYRSEGQTPPSGLPEAIHELAGIYLYLHLQQEEP